MKIRISFVSNSSSSSFVVRLSNFSLEDQNRIYRLEDRSFDTSRCTGVITDIRAWLEMIDAEAWDDIKKLMEEYDDLIILRESDEGMGGLFEDVGVSYGNISEKALLEFEYH